LANIDLRFTIDTIYDWFDFYYFATRAPRLEETQRDLFSEKKSVFIRVLR